MKNINYLFGLMLSIGLFSCTDDQLLDEGQSGNKTQQKIEATMEVKNAVIGIGGEAPATRGSQYVGNLNEDRKNQGTTKEEKVNDSQEVGDLLGYLKYAYLPKTIDAQKDEIILGENYVKKTKMNADLIIGMECGDQKAFFHLAGPKTLTILDKDNVAKIAQLTMAEAGGTTALTLKDKSQFTDDDRDKPVIIADQYDVFKENVRAGKKLTVYVSAMAGGNFKCKEARNHYAPSQDFDPDKPYWVTKGYGSTNRIKEKIPFFSGINEDNNGDKSAKKRDAVPMDIPLTTQGWEQIGSNRVQLEENGKWTIDLSDIEINLKPSGSLIALTLKNNAMSDGDDGDDADPKNDSPNRQPTEAWLTSFEMKKVHNSELNIPMSTNVEMSKEWIGREVIKDCDSFIGFGKIYLNGNYTGNMEPGKYSRPIYLWAHGRGDLYVKFLCHKKRYNKVAGTVYPNVSSIDDDNPDRNIYPWYEFYTSQNGGEKIGYCYGNSGFGFGFFADFNKMEEGKSYLCRFDDENRTEENNDGLIMTEIFMPQKVDNNGKANYEGYTMLEVYNPTDHPIDLRKYGLIRQYDYKHYVKDGKGEGYKGSYPNLSAAKIQVLYVDNIQDPVYTMGGEVVEGVPNLFRQTPESGNYIPFLQPGKTAVYLAAKWVDKHYFYRDKTMFRTEKGDEVWKYYPRRIPMDLHDMMFENIDNGNCQFIVSLRNGVGKINHEENTSALEMGWFEKMHLTGLLLVQKKSNKWRVVDVFGVTENDDPILKQINPDDKQDAGEKYTQKALGRNGDEPFANYFDNYNICIIRNNRPGDNEQNLRFINDDRSLVIGEDPEKHLWLIRPFTGATHTGWPSAAKWTYFDNIDNPSSLPYGVSFGSRWADSKN